MILSLEDAKQINPDVTQEYLDGLEIAIRQLTNNNFLNQNILYRQFNVPDNETLEFERPINYLREGDTVLLAYTWGVNTNGSTNDKGVNDGLFIIDKVDGATVTLETDQLFEGDYPSAMMAKVEYPSDLIQGVKKLIEYDKSMAGKTGVKSETYSRMSTTYYDVNAAENVNGYPAAYMSFLNKYKKLRW